MYAGKLDCPCVSDLIPTLSPAQRYFYGQENEFWDDMQANGVSRRRFFQYTLLGAAVALGGNLFGVTSGLLGVVAPDASRDARLDILFPVKGFKRCGGEYGAGGSLSPQKLRMCCSLGCSL